MIALSRAFAPPSPTASTLRVLVIDDDTDQHVLMRAWLEAIYGSACELTVVERASDGLSRLTATVYDVAFVDYYLAGHSGLDLIREAQRRGCTTPLVMLTGALDADLDRAALEAGAADYLEKAALNERALERAIRYTRERARAADRLRASEEWYRALVDQSTEGVALLDASGCFVYANERAAALLAPAEGALIGSSWPTGVEPEGSALSAALDQPATPVAVEFRREGSAAARWIECTLVNRLADPIVRGIAVTCRDASERVLMERALHLQAEIGRILAFTDRLEDMRESVLRAIGERLTARVAGMWRGDGSGRLSLVHAWCRPDDTAAAEFAHGAAGEVAHDEVLDQAAARGRAVWLADAGHSLRFERRERARRCGIRGGLIVPILTTQNSVRGAFEVYWDHLFPHNERLLAILTAVGRQLGHFMERLEAQAALAASERQLRALFDQSSDAILLTDDDGRYVDANPAGLELLGVSLEELRGRPIASFLPDEQRAGFADTWRSFLESGEMSGEVVLVRANGQRRTADFRATTSILPGRHLSQLRDVTERRELEEQLLQSQKMEMVGRLAGGVAHDFNNLLMVILGNTHLIAGDLPADHELRPLAQDVVQAAQSAASLTAQLLAFSRKQVMQTSVFNLNDTVTSMDRMLARLIGETIVLETRLDPAISAVKADQSQIEQIIVNLVVNARDAMPGGGRLTIATSDLTVRRRAGSQQLDVAPGRYVVLTVTDTGIGMDAVTRARIFEPFFTTKERGRGTGLGLSTVYGIARQSGGHITVDSELGRGTTFAVYLPAEGGELIRDPARTAVAAGGGSETVLVVEDSDEVRRLTTELLRRHGYAVLEAGTGEEALRIANRRHGAIDLLLTDVVMPGASGREVYERLVVTRPRLRVVYCSGYTDEIVLQHGVTNREVAFLQKPFTLASLLSTVRMVLDA